MDNSQTELNGVFFEILSPKFVKKDIEKSISKSGAVFTFGAASGEEIARLAPSFRWKGDRSLVEGMEVIFPVFKLIGKIGAVRNISNKIVVLEKTEFDARMGKGLADAKAGRGLGLDEAFDQLVNGKTD